MRANVVSLILLALLLALGVSVVMRERVPHASPAPSVSGSASARASASAAPSASAPAAPAASGPLPLTPAKPKPKLGRPLRVVASGWDLIAPVLLQTGGKGKSFEKAGLSVEARAVDGMLAVEGALARGGGDPAGADVALVPLPALVASYDKLRALDPVVFYVTGWSAGRELLTGPSLDTLPAKGDVLVNSAGTPAATLLALFALSESGVAPERVKLDGDKAKIVAVSHELDDSESAVKQTSVLLSTADASRLSPFVAVAPRSLLVQHADSLLGWVKGYLAGQKQLAADPPAAARAIATKEGAPEPIALLARLGEVDAASLHEDAELFGLSGRGAVTLDSLLIRSWALWRAASLTTSPPPEVMPFDGRIVAGLVRADPKLAAPPSSRPKKPDEAAQKTQHALLVRRVAGPTLDEDRALDTIGFLAGIFPRSPLRVTVHRGGAAASKALAGRAVDRFGIAPERVVPGKLAPKAGAVVSIEVLSVP